MNKENKNRKTSLPKGKLNWQFPVVQLYLFATFLALLSSFLLASGWTQRLDYIFYDTFLRLQPVATTTSSVVVAIDEKSLNELGRYPWDRAVHAELIGKLKAAGAEAIVLDILMTEPGPEHSDQALRQQLELADNVLLPLHIDHLNFPGRLTELLPIPALATAAAGLGHAHLELDADGISRGLYLYQGVGDSHWPSIALAAYQLVNKAPLKSPVTTTSNVTSNTVTSNAVTSNAVTSNAVTNNAVTNNAVTNNNATNNNVTNNNATNNAASASLSQNPEERSLTSDFMNIREAYRLIPFIGPPGSLANLSYSDVLAADLPADYFAGRVVFVGATAAGIGDFVATPVSGELINMPGVEFHANVYEALTGNRLGILMDTTWQYLITLGIVLAVAFIFPKLSPNTNLPLTVTLMAAVCVYSYLLLLVEKQWFAPATLLVTLLLAYPLWSWRRLLRLNRFLNQELERLAGEPKLRQLSSYQTPQQWALQLVRLLKPVVWEFRDYKDGHEPQVTIDPSQRFAEIFLPVLDQRSLVALYMKIEAPPEKLQAIIRYVQQLFPEFHAGLPGPGRPGELIDRRIMQVREAIETMQDMRQFVSDTVENMPGGVLVGDEFGRIMFVNEPARSWLRGDAQPGTYIAECMPVSNQVAASRWEIIIREILINGTTQAEELRMEETAVLITLVPINFTNHSTGMVVTFADISVIHEAQLKRMETINFISHDLRSPLTSQLALLDTLKLALPAEFEPKITQAQHLTEKSLALANQFLQLARVETASHIHLYECELLDIIDNAADSSMPLAQKDQIGIQRFYEYESIPITGNPELLERCLANLIQNALKVSPPQSQVNIRIHLQAHQVIVEVEDQGSGIAAHEIPHLFEAYRRTRDSEKQGAGGSGLGLRFVKLVVDRHGGDIEVSTKPGEGTRFLLYLPANSKLAVKSPVTG